MNFKKQLNISKVSCSWDLCLSIKDLVLESISRNRIRIGWYNTWWGPIWQKVWLLHGGTYTRIERTSSSSSLGNTGPPLSIIEKEGLPPPSLPVLSCISWRATGTTYQMAFQKSDTGTSPLSCRGFIMPRPRWVFRYVGNKTFDFSSKKKGFFAPKRPNLAQNWHFWSIWARPCRLLRSPVSGSVGGWGVRAVSRKTPIYFIVQDNFL